ncbi:Cell division control 1-like protein [Cladobotryum mycophilum]|uniref:Cell division control 1-like protein n=1 Tax=Cladobotryum mycophilum TaxID=491253 RepID=A0ABR0SLB5_9HYPO
MPPYNRSVAEELSHGAKALAHALWVWIKGSGRHMATAFTIKFLHRIRINLTSRRLLSFPHLLVLFWLVILLWGERWIFDSKVQDCDWKNWEKWPKGATPHHLVFVADPQIVDPHTYPGRPWPLSSLTPRLHCAAETSASGQPFFLGDLFDGGREWKTRNGRFVDPKWGRGRSSTEKKWVRTWHRKYGEDFWLHEYQRFSDIFFSGWNAGGDAPGAWQRGRKLVASLPGNHDLGFGAMVQVPVRNRFSAYFGEGNRVDIVGNHTIVSVDAVSLSADSSDYRNGHDLTPIYGPVTEFLDGVQATKRKLAQEELNAWYGLDHTQKLKHAVEELDTAVVKQSTRDPGPGAADFPTLLLTHVPLYRPPGTPCGPKRERWPPTKPPKGQTSPVVPDERNAISVVAGYQYQNVLNEDDSVKLIKSIGNVVHVFSGDDHDYCEVVHSPSKQNVREITVKSISMAMGVSNPGFLMVSLYNPIDKHGKPLPGSPQQTLQTHLCILPNQVHTYMRYITFGLLSLGLLALRAFLVPVLRLTPFALQREQSTSVLPIYKDKVEPPDSSSTRYGSSGTSSNHYPSRSSAAPRTGGSRRSLSTTNASLNNGAPRWESKKAKQGGRWGWNDDSGPRIKLDDNFYDGGKAWKNTGRDRRFVLGEAGREMWTTSWRVVWVTVLFWVHLTKSG